MAVVLRLQRCGKRIQPSYRVVAIEKRRGPRGKPVEIIGSYNPKAEKIKDKIRLNLERYEYWLKVGAKPSPTLQSLVEKLKKEVTQEQ